MDLQVIVRYMFEFIFESYGLDIIKPCKRTELLKVMSTAEVVERSNQNLCSFTDLFTSKQAYCMND